MLGLRQSHMIFLKAVPEDLNWDLWLGSLTAKIHYNHELDPPIKLDPVEDWKPSGAHGAGTQRWVEVSPPTGAPICSTLHNGGLGMDRNGPVEASPIGDGTEYMSFKYANGVVMTSEPFDEKKTKG